MIICSVNHVAKMYGGNMVFEDITFEIKEKERLALVGRNGNGKTTLLRLLAGEELADAGKIHWKKGASRGILQQIPEGVEGTGRDVLKQAFSELTKIAQKMEKLERDMANEADAKRLEKLVSEYGTLQEIFTVKGGYEIEAEIEKIIHGLNMESFIQQPFRELSGGEKTKVGLGQLLLKQPDLLLLDEPTNHLDLMTVEWLEGFLQDYEGTVLVISHDRYFLDEVVDKVMDLEDGELTTYHTNFTGYVKEKEKRLLQAFQDYEEQQKKIKKMKEAIKRLREWANRANPPNADLHRRARNMERALERMDKLNRPVLGRKKMGLEMEAGERSGKDVIQLRDVKKSFSGKQLFADISMHLVYQERAAIIGENGSGKSTLLKLILGEIAADGGEIQIGSNVKIGYLSQHVFQEAKHETVIEAFRNKVRVTEGEARNILAKFMFYGYAVFQKVSGLSGGERMRLRLAELMYQDVNLLILDEPTNHLDIDSREVLEEALEDFNGTILAVSHDRYFLNRLFEKIYWMKDGTLYAFNGSYSWAKEKMEETKAWQVGKKELDRKQEHILYEKEPSERKHNENKVEKELKVLEERIIELEKKLSETQDLDLLQQLYKEKEELEEKWQALIEKLD
ncbi:MULTISPECIES: ribosomal protection-like ABC-F family protein [unclassified Oceanobacillus]|uniref:ribosomal protection-like ABC-F family protein n=1 Tax=unclassified Oceanobacillus TaxID=2630292 RepID=UPI00300E4E19